MTNVHTGVHETDPSASCLKANVIIDERICKYWRNSHGVDNLNYEEPRINFIWVWDKEACRTCDDKTYKNGEPSSHYIVCKPSKEDHYDLSRLCVEVEIADYFLQVLVFSFYVVVGIVYNVRSSRQ